MVTNSASLKPQMGSRGNRRRGWTTNTSAALIWQTDHFCWGEKMRKNSKCTLEMAKILYSFCGWADWQRTGTELRLLSFSLWSPQLLVAVRGQGTLCGAWCLHAYGKIIIIKIFAKFSRIEMTHNCASCFSVVFPVSCRQNSLTVINFFLCHRRYGGVLFSVRKSTASCNEHILSCFCWHGCWLMLSVRFSKEIASFLSLCVCMPRGYCPILAASWLVIRPKWIFGLPAELGKCLWAARFFHSCGRWRCHSVHVDCTCMWLSPAKMEEKNWPSSHPFISSHKVMMIYERDMAIKPTSLSTVRSTFRLKRVNELD